MNVDDPFEQRLTRQSLRAVPDKWRDDILACADDLQSPSAASQLSTFNSQPRLLTAR